MIDRKHLAKLFAMAREKTECGDSLNAKCLYKECLELRPDRHYENLIRFNLSLVLLARGEYKEGFEQYEYRYKLFPQIDWLSGAGFERWQGQSLKSKSILVISEQGYGDVIQFSRYLMALHKLGAQVYVALKKAHASLAPVIQRMSSVKKLVVSDAKGFLNLPVRPDYYCLIMSLPLYLYCKVGADVGPYLQAPMNKSILPELNESEKVTAGLVWRTELQPSEMMTQLKDSYKNKNEKGISLEFLMDTLRELPISFFSLQLDHTDDEKQLMLAEDIHDLSAVISDFDDTAALIKQLDIVISIDTAVAHLAAAMGKPVYLLLMEVADWRWQGQRLTSRYPNINILSQQQQGDWGPVLDKLKVTLGSVGSAYRACE